MTLSKLGEVILLRPRVVPQWVLQYVVRSGFGEREILVFIGTCSVTTTLVSAFTKSDNRAKVKFSFDLLEPHIGSLLLAFLCLT